MEISIPSIHVNLMTDKENITSGEDHGGEIKSSVIQQPNKAISSNSGPILLCQTDGNNRPVLVGFGCAPIRQKNKKSVTVYNPSPESPALLVISDKIKCNTLRISFENNSETDLPCAAAIKTVSVPPLCSVILGIVWTPDTVAPLNENICITLNGTKNLCLLVSGIATPSQVCH